MFNLDLLVNKDIMLEPDPSWPLEVMDEALEESIFEEWDLLIAPPIQSEPWMWN